MFRKLQFPALLALFVCSVSSCVSTNPEPAPTPEKIDAPESGTSPGAGATLPEETPAAPAATPQITKSGKTSAKLSPPEPLPAPPAAELVQQIKPDFVPPIQEILLSDKTGPSEPVMPAEPGPPGAVTDIPATKAGSATSPAVSVALPAGTASGSESTTTEQPAVSVTKKTAHDRTRPAIPAARKTNAPATDSSEETNSAEQFTAPVNEEIRIVLETGWTFTGFIPDEGHVRFERKDQDNSDGKTLFVFRTLATGTLSLHFEKTDLSNGRTTQKHYVLDILSHDEYLAMLQGIREPAENSQAPGFETAEQAKDGNLPESPLQILSRLVSDAEYEQALAFFLADSNGLQDNSNCVPLLENILAEKPDTGPDSETDALLFALAGLLEKNNPYRDIQRADDLYTRLMKEYPVSRFYDRARIRSVYLKRHFFTIRG